MSIDAKMNDNMDLIIAQYLALACQRSVYLDVETERTYEHFIPVDGRRKCFVYDLKSAIDLALTF